LRTLLRRRQHSKRKLDPDLHFAQRLKHSTNDLANFVYRVPRLVMLPAAFAAALPHHYYSQQHQRPHCQPQCHVSELWLERLCSPLRQPSQQPSKVSEFVSVPEIVRPDVSYLSVQEQVQLLLCPEQAQTSSLHSTGASSAWLEEEGWSQQQRIQFEQHGLLGCQLLGCGTLQGRPSWQQRRLWWQ